MTTQQSITKRPRGMFSSLKNVFLLQNIPLFRDSPEYLFKGSSCFCEYLSNTKLFKTEQDVIDNYSFLVGELRDWLDSKGYITARAAMDFMLEKSQNDFRDDGITPKALHEITEAIWFISAIEDGLPADDPELILSIIFVHDLGEDYDVSPEDLIEDFGKCGFQNKKRMDAFLTGFDAITKYYGGNGRTKYYAGIGKNKNEGEYQRNIMENPHASVAKIFDRAQNNMTLVGVRRVRKMHDEIAKTEHYYEYDKIISMCNKHPQHTQIYTTMHRLLKKQTKLSRFYTVDDADSLPVNRDIRDWMPKTGFSHIPDGLNPLLVIAERIKYNPRMRLGEDGYFNKSLHLENFDASTIEL